MILIIPILPSPHNTSKEEENDCYINIHHLLWSECFTSIILQSLSVCTVCTTYTYVYISDVHCVVRAPSSTFCYLHLYKCRCMYLCKCVLDYSTENITLLLVNLMAPHIQFTFRTKLFLCLIHGEIYKHTVLSFNQKPPLAYDFCYSTAAAGI